MAPNVLDPVTAYTAPASLPQSGQPLAKQGKESQGRNGPPAVLCSSLVYSTGAIFAALEELVAIPRLQRIEGSSV